MRGLTRRLKPLRPVELGRGALRVHQPLSNAPEWEPTGGVSTSIPGFGGDLGCATEHESGSASLNAPWSYGWRRYRGNTNRFHDRRIEVRSTGGNRTPTMSRNDLPRSGELVFHRCIAHLDAAAVEAAKQADIGVRHFGATVDYREPIARTVTCQLGSL